MFYQAVSVGFFETMGMPIVDGRTLVSQDADQPVAIINEDIMPSYAVLFAAMALGSIWLARPTAPRVLAVAALTLRAAARRQICVPE